MSERTGEEVRSITGRQAMFYFILIVSALVFVVGTTVLVERKVEAHSSASASTYTCTAGPGEQCFSDLFYADFERFKSLREKVVSMQKDPDTKALEMAEKSDQLNGMAMRLNNEIPKGYVVDEKKLRFVSTTPAAPPQPAPALPAPKK
jgi:hypothetical protein